MVTDKQAKLLYKNPTAAFPVAGNEEEGDWLRIAKNPK